MRTISADMKEAIFSEETDLFPIILLTFQHPDWEGAIYLCDAAIERISTDPLVYGLTSNGQEYIYLPIGTQLPDDVDERAPSAKLMIENVDRRLIPAVRSVITPGTCNVSIVMSNDLDHVEIEYPTMQMRNAQFNQDILTLEIGLDALETEPFPAGSYTPSYFPGMF